MTNKVTLWPSGQVVEVTSSESLLMALREKGVFLKSSCGGVASCRDCIVKVMSGEDALTPPTFEEIKILGNVFHITKERLSCQTKVSGEVTVDISAHEGSSEKKKTSEKDMARAKAILRKRAEVKEREQRSPYPKSNKKVYKDGGRRRPKSFPYKKED